MLKNLFSRKKPAQQQPVDASQLNKETLDLQLLLHSYKTPLSVIIGYTELLISDMVADENERKDMLAKILEKAKHLSTLTYSLNVKLNTDSGLNNTYKKETDIVSIARRVADSMAKIAASYGIKISLTAAAPIVLQLDEFKFAIIFEELMTNAFKHMGRPGIINIIISDIDGQVLVVFKNDGMGIEPSECERIFECGYKSAGGDSGLGLFSVKTMVEAHGGTVYAKSSPNTGFGIYIMLPRT